MCEQLGCQVAGERWNEAVIDSDGLFKLSILDWIERFSVGYFAMRPEL